MLELLLKASFVSGIALLFYKLVLQQESFFGLNRIYLMSCLALAFALPFVSLPKLVEEQGYLSTLMAPLHSPPPQSISSTTSRPAPAKEAARKEVGEHKEQEAAREPSSPIQNTAHTAQTGPAPTTDWRFWMITLYLFGALIFFLNLLFQAANIVLKAAKNPDKIEDGACIIVNTAQPQAPCSFFHYIFIYPNDYDFATYEQILAHEKIHVRLRHSLDLLFAELAVIVLWFNPLIWLYKNEVEKNLEFQTDALLLQQESIDKQQYQLSLLQIATPHKPLTITTNYNQSLLKQRIFMMNAKKSNLHGYWKYAFLAPILFGTLLMLNEPATSQTPPPPTLQTSPPQAEQPLPAAEAPAYNQPYNIHDMSKGYWYSQQKGGQYCLELRGDLDKSHWSMTNCFDKGAFSKKSDDLFELSRESGTLRLMGKLDVELSQGKYEFKKNEAFESYLASNNIKSSDQNLQFLLFLNDVGKDYISFLKTQYQQLSGDRLLEVAIHGISMKEYQGYLDLFQKYSNHKPSMQEVIEASIHEIDHKYIEELQSLGFNNLSLRKMMEARIHEVDRVFIEDLKKAGFKDLSMDKIIQAKIHDLDPVSIREIRALGFDADLDRIIEMRIHGVDAAFIQELKNAGFGKLDIDDIIAAKIHDLNPASIKAIRELGFRDLSLKKMIELQMHDVNVEFLQELKALGFAELSVDKVLEARIHDVNADYIRKAREKGYKFNNIDQYITLKIHGFARYGDEQDLN